MSAPLTIATTNLLRERWFSTYSEHDYQENYLEFWPPYSDLHWRLREAFRESNSHRIGNILYLALDMKLVGAVPERSWGTLLLQQLESISFESFFTNGNQLRLFVYHWEALPSTEIFDGLRFLAGIYDQFRPNLGLRIFSQLSLDNLSDRNITLPQSLLQNLQYQPLYNEADCLAFISHMSDQYESFISPATAKHIIELSGGHLWLLTQMIRAAATNTSVVLQDDETLIYKSRLIYDALSKSERELIDSVRTGAKIQTSSISPYLRQTGLLDTMHNTNSPRLRIRLWQNDTRVSGTDQPTGSIAIGVQIPPLFTVNLSADEKAVWQLFFTNKNKLISREQITAVLVKPGTLSRSGQQNVDQRLEKRISRLRQKMKKYRLSLEIKGKHGLGYVMIDREDNPK